MGETVGLTILLLDLGKERITWETKKAQIKTEGGKKGPFTDRAAREVDPLLKKRKTPPIKC